MRQIFHTHDRYFNILSAALGYYTIIIFHGATIVFFFLSPCAQYATMATSSFVVVANSHTRTSVREIVPLKCLHSGGGCVARAGDASACVGARVTRVPISPSEPFDVVNSSAARAPRRTEHCTKQTFPSLTGWGQRRRTLPPRAAPLLWCQAHSRRARSRTHARTHARAEEQQARQAHRGGGGGGSGGDVYVRVCARGG